MEDRYINLKELLPLYLQEYSELAEIMDTETPEFRLLESRHNRMIDNRYIISCDEEGIARFEKILGMTPKSDDTLEDRIFRCLTKWNVCLPYNYAFLERKLKELCGTEYAIDFDIPGQTMIVKIGIAQKNQYDSVVDILDEIVPCNILLNTELLYNQYRSLKPYPHIILGQFTLGIEKHQYSEESEFEGRKYRELYNGRIIAVYSGTGCRNRTEKERIT